MTSIETKLAEIEAVRKFSSSCQQAISEAFIPKFEMLRKDGAHEDDVRHLRDLMDDVRRTVEHAERRMLESYQLADLMPAELAKVIPVESKPFRMALVQPKDSEFAFFVYMDCHYVITSYKLYLEPGLQFGFLCGCSNCNKGCQKDAVPDPVQLVEYASRVAKESGIKKVVMRHCSGWPQEPARKHGVSLREIEDSVFQEDLEKLVDRYKAKYGSGKTT